MAPRSDTKVAYIMSRFPNLTETFVLYEMVAVERQGARVSVYPLLRQRQTVVHPEAEAIAQRAHYHPFLSRKILAANWHFLRKRPRAYFRVLFEILRGTFGSANFFFGALAIFPKSVRFALEMVEEGVTHVHAHFANHPTITALIVHRLTGLPFSFTAHGHDVHVDRRMLAHKVNAASFAVMISEYNRKLVLDDCAGVDPRKLHVLHCGADTSSFAPRSTQQVGRPFTIVCLGSFIEVKGHPYLLEACRQVADSGVDVLCHLVGDGPDREKIEALIETNGLTENVVVHGALARPRVVELLGESDVIVQPSVPTERGSREGIPVSLMEGMACGLPVVASRISGIPELVEDGRNGFLIEPRDALGLAEALRKLAEDPELRARMGESGRETVLDDFDLDGNAERLLDLIDSVARETPDAGMAGDVKA